MSKKQKRQPRRRSPAANAPPPKPRRLPAPRLPPDVQLANPGQPPASSNTSSSVTEIVQFVLKMAAAAKLQPLIILKDWLGMMESGLKMWPANMRAMALEGQFIEDPPDIQAIFTQARERYLRISRQRPAVYRQMQAAFAEAFALLLDSTGPGLEQVSGNPDVIGQVFTTCLQPGSTSPWWFYFPDWPTTLAAAQAAIPDGGELVYLTLAEAALRARHDGHTIQLEPGANFPEWFETVWPYMEPVVIGPPLISSGAGLLAAARQFPDWALKTALVKFTWTEELDHLVKQMIHIDAMLYGLNGYLMDHYEALAEIQAHLLASPDTMAAGYPLPQVFGENQEPVSGSQPQGEIAAGQTFTDLFRQKSRS